ncbi:MAG: ATP-binding cassette domain-containing protein [Bacteroidota bacterium]
MLRLVCKIPSGQIIGITGPSGSGKTTLLRILSGLTQPDEGKLIVDNKIWYDSESGAYIPTEDRELGFVFQSDALFPNMTVNENIDFATPSSHRRDRRILSLLTSLKIQDLGDRHIDTLSGGQRQRISIARALARKPEVLLLDEPTTALDRALRDQVMQTIVSDQLQNRYSIFWASHDVDTLIRHSDHIIQITNGDAQYYSDLDDFRKLYKS